MPMASNTGGYGATLRVTVVTSANTYAAGQAVGALNTLTNAVRAAAGSGRIEYVSIADIDKQNAPLDVFFFTAAPTVPTDHATFAPSNTDLFKIVGHVPVLAANYSSFTANSVATVVPTNSLLFSLPAGTSLFAVIVSRGTPAYTTAGSLQLGVGVSQN